MALTKLTNKTAIRVPLGIINDLSQTYIFDTVVAFKASLIEFPDGKTIHLKDRGADFTIIDGQSGDGTGVIPSTSVSQSLTLIKEFPLNPEQFGAIGNGDDTLYITSFLAAIRGNKGVLTVDKNYSVTTTASSLLIDTDNTTLTGGGKITALDSANNLILLSGTNCTIDGVELEGDGTFTSDKAVLSASRIALIRITGDKPSVSNCTLVKGHQVFIGADGLGSGSFIGNKFYGGISAYNPNVDTGYQGLQAKDCKNLTIKDNEVFELDGGKVAEGLNVAAGSTTNNNGHIITGNKIYAAYDHGLYLNLAHGCLVDGNTTTTDSAGIVCASIFDVTGTVKYKGNICTNNILTASPTPEGIVGLSLRDCNDSIIEGNKVSGFERGIQLSPITYSHANLTLNNNTVSGNIVTGFSDVGILLAAAGRTLKEMNGNKVENNIVVGAENATTDGVSMLLGAGLVKYNSISSNHISKVGDAGIRLQAFDFGVVNENTIVDCARSAGASKTGILTISCLNTRIEDNDIIALDVPEMVYGISGSNNSDSCTVRGNKILGATSVAIRQFQYVGNKNTFDGNSSGNDPLIGTLTLSAAVTTTISTDNINANFGMTSYVSLEPLNQSAATLIGGANSPYVLQGDITPKISFKVRQAGSAAGTEMFRYTIHQ